MTVDELIEKLKSLPKDYQVVFESGDAYGSAYYVYVGDIRVKDKDNRISDLINFEKEDGETILPRKLNIDELKLWFNQKIMNNPYKDDPVIKEYSIETRDKITDNKKNI